MNFRPSWVSLSRVNAGRRGPDGNQGTEAEGCLNRGLNGLGDFADFLSELGFSGLKD